MPKRANVISCRGPSRVAMASLRRSLRTTLAVATVAATVAAMLAATVTPAAAAPQSVAVPAYFYPIFPDPLWTQMEDAVPTVAFAVMNPANGAGVAADANYTAQIAATRAAGVKILGYVYSSYATRDPALLEADIDNYHTWYDVDGIFIDEADNNCVNEPYYAALDAYEKSKGGLGLTVINPGTVTPECFAAAADIILNFEGSYAQYQTFSPLGWEANYDASRFWHLVYATAEVDMPAAVLLSQAHGAGFVYVTPDTLLPNPWDSLPGEPYWSTELAYVQPIAGACPAPVSKPKIKIRGVNTPEPDDSLKFSGKFTLAGMPAVDPIADGLRLVVGDSDGADVDFVIAAGAYDGDSGWTSGNGKWKYRGDRDAPAFGIKKATIKTKPAQASTLVTFRITGVGAAYPVSAAQFPLTAAVLLSPAAPTTNCATASFPGPTRTCTLTANATTIRCK
jgi:hypothetical protein